MSSLFHQATVSEKQLVFGAYLSSASLLLVQEKYETHFTIFQLAVSVEEWISNS
jgi:hypothetical protein